MRRTTLLAVFGLTALLAGCGASSSTFVSVPPVAGTQSAALGWVENFGQPQSRLVFRVHSFRVTRDGWSARMSITNETAATFAIDGLSNPFGDAFGLMLFGTGSHVELEERNKTLALPTLRPATTVAPALPASLVPRSTWNGTISAHGALPSGLWVRLVFGRFVPEGTVPKSLSREDVTGGVTWITDHTYRLL